MRKLSLNQVYGCSTIHRHSIIGLPDNRVAFLAGSYLVILDCQTNERRYLLFSAIEYLYISPSGLLMGVIDRLNDDGDRRIHLYSTKPIDLLGIIEPDRFGNFIGIAINYDDTNLMILHDEPAYMITIQEIHTELEEQGKFQMVDFASVRAVHGPVMNRMTGNEIVPRVVFISFCPFVSNRFCASGTALFQIYDIENQNAQQQNIHFRAEFYGFTCHCWLAANSILTATDYGHLFWIEDGLIRSDINLHDSITVHINLQNIHLSNDDDHLRHRSITSISSLEDDLSSRASTININNISMTEERQSTKLNDISNESVVYLDLFQSKEIAPYLIVSFEEYLLAFIPISIEPFFQLAMRYRLEKSHEHQIDSEKHRIHKMSSIFDHNSSFIYLLTDRNQIFRFEILLSNEQKKTIELKEQHLYGFHGYNILSMGLCAHKSWLITLGADHWIRILDYNDNNREVIAKYIPDGASIVTGSDPYGFHLCLAMNNRFHLYLITHFELRLIHQYETRNIRDVEMSQSGHLIAIITNNLIQIYSTIHFNLISQLRGHIGKIKQVIWCKNDSILITCGSDGMIYLFNTLTGVRENEIITKQFHYIGIAATNDCNRLYAITSDPSIKIFHQTHFEQEWTIENQYLPSAICLSKSERYLYLGMTHGLIRIYTIPLTFDTYIDVPAHYSSIRRLLVTYDDQYLISMAESAYILLFKQSVDVFSSISNQFQLSQFSQENLEKTNEYDRQAKKFDYILVTKSEFDEHKRKIQEIQAKINELETENNIKLRSKQLSFSKHFNHSFEQYQTIIKQLISTYEQLKSSLADDQTQFLHRTNEINEKNEVLQNQAEIIYENQMLETLSRIQTTRNELVKIEDANRRESIALDNQNQVHLNEITERINRKLQEKWQIAVQDHNNMEEKERQLKEYIRQMENEAEDEFEQVKQTYENQLKHLNEYTNQLTVTVGTLRKRYNEIITRMESRDIERTRLEREVHELRTRQTELTEKLDHFQLIIKKKEDRIGIYDIKLHQLQQQILHVEKRKYVLDYQTKSLLERIEPMDEEMNQLKENNEKIEEHLTNLKRQQNELIVQEKENQIKVEQALKQLNQAKINHQSIWKVVKRYKDAIKKAFEYTEINCTIDSRNASEQLRKLIEHLCQTMQNETQTENQIEMEGFIKEWNNQRKWLLNQLDNLTKHTERNKQSFANVQREHRKALAPFINQLRDLHHLSNDIEKKIHKHFLALKIKSNEQREFLQTISEILHGNDKYHLVMNELNQTECHIEIQEQEIDYLSSLVFRAQYSTPCLDNSPTKITRTRSTVPSMKN